MTQQGDVRLFQTNDGGEINVVNGLIEMSGGLETAVYLSLFGGNEDDPGEDDKSKMWWGNFTETDSKFFYRSRAQFLLATIPAITGNLRRIESAIEEDLNWMRENGVVDSLNFSVSLTAPKRIEIIIEINGTEKLVFVENWRVEL